MISFLVIMGQVFADSTPQHLLAEKDHPGQTFGFYTQVKSFQMWIQVGAPGRKPHRLHAFVFQGRSERTAKVRISIHQKVVT
jgi:hypothetical protein